MRAFRVVVLVAVVLLLRPTPSWSLPTVVVPSDPTFTAVATGFGHSCGLRPDGTIACWGDLGGDLPPGPFVSVAAGSQGGSCGIRADGTLTCWGETEWAQVPQSVGNAVRSVAAHYDHACALKADETVVCWGRNEDGQTQSVAGTFTAVTVGASHTCALRTDQSIVCWGGEAASPVPIAGQYTAVAAGGGHTCALRVAKSVACWGSDSSGQAPSTVSGAFSALASGAEHSCAIRTDGSLTCWGRNLEGEAPRSVAGPFVAVAAGNYNTCALRANLTVRCWGQGGIPMLPSEPRPAPPAGFLGTPYAHSFSAGDPYSLGPVEFSHTGQLPAGLSLTTDGQLSGVPSKRGSFAFAVSARNMFGVATTQVTLAVVTPGLDVNGDGVIDLAVGAPGEDVGSIVDGGAVTVLFGSPGGTFGTSGSLQITQETVGQKSEKGDRCGAAIAVADVSGDANQDLIIGMPGEDAGAGQVVVIQGSFAKMTGATRTVLRQGLSGAAGAAEAGDGFGSAVSVGDGLWVGAPREDLGRAADAGVVTRFPVKPLRTAGSIQYQQGSRKVPGSPEAGDRFGAALAEGGTLVGAPGEDVGSIIDAGVVTTGLTRAVSQDSPGIPGAAERGDRFGAAVASARLWTADGESGAQSWLDLLAVGAPGEDVGSVRDAGAVTLIDTEFLSDPDWGDLPTALVQNTLSAGQTVEAGDQFGGSVLIATKTTGTRSDDAFPGTVETDARLVFGAPGEDVGAVANAGAVTVLPASSWCTDNCYYEVAPGSTLTQGSKPVGGAAGTGNTFGATLAQLPGVGLRLAIGAPGQTVSDHPTAGSVTVINPRPVPPQQIHQDSPGVQGAAENGDRFSTLPTWTETGTSP